MEATPEITLLQETRQSIERMQNFDTKQLSREKELGEAFSFNDAIPLADLVINLYNQLSINVLEDLPENELNSLKQQANSDFNRLQEILDFSTEQPDPHGVRHKLIKQVESSYQPAFTKLHPIISYSTSKSADFKRLESDARAMIQSVKDQADELRSQLEESNNEANSILENIRKVAAERGVSQQATFFKEVSEDHEKQARNWQIAIIWISVGLAIYAIGSIFIHKIPYLTPADTYQAIQLAVSKVLIFAVITYMLYLSAKNFLAHKHNSIVNKHRQTALMTYKALVDAAKETDNKEVVLIHAAACIFSPQNTGYGREKSLNTPTAKSVVELLAKPFISEEG